MQAKKALFLSIYGAFGLFRQLKSPGLSVRPASQHDADAEAAA